MKPSLLRLPVALLLALPPLASAQIFQAPFGAGGTWNVYEVVGTAATWKAAQAAAVAKVDPVNGTVNGTLVSIISAAENTFINRTVRGQADTWIGLTDREGAAPGAQESQTAGTPANRTTGWAWTSGEAFVYNNWGGGEPNDAGGAEDAAQLRGDGQWNDNASGLLLNDPIVPVLQPGTSNLEGTAAFGYVVEYLKQSASPLPGIRIGSALTAPGTIPGPSGGVGTWGVREVTGLTGTGNIATSVDQLRSGLGTSTTGTFTTLNTTDPETNAPGGSALSTPANPFLTNTAADDNDRLTIAKGRISVTEAGTYTFQVHSDDGFALRVVGQNFTSVNGGGYLDPLDSSTMAFAQGTGDANTRGVINLAIGTYDLEFVHFEGGGGAYYELTSAKGTVTDAKGAQWIAVGDASTKAAAAADVVRLVSAATVTNAAKPGDNNVATARTAVENAITAGTAVSGTFTSLNIAENQMPIATAVPPVADNYATKVAGQIRLDNLNGVAGESLALTFSLRSDDGSSLQILGQDFSKATDLTGDGTAALVDVGGDMTLVADYPTGNTNAFGLISLTEGQTYNFVSYHSEGGGGSTYQLWYALGDRTVSGFDESIFNVLSVGSDALLAANTGLALVPEPSTTGLAGLAFLGLLRRRSRK